MRIFTKVNTMGVPVRNADGMDQCQVRIPKGLLEKIDELVDQKKFASRTDFFRTITIEYFSEDKQKEKLLALLDEPGIRSEIRNIVKEGL